MRSQIHVIQTPHMGYFMSKFFIVSFFLFGSFIQAKADASNPGITCTVNHRSRSATHTITLTCIHDRGQNKIRREAIEYPDSDVQRGRRNPQEDILQYEHRLLSRGFEYVGTSRSGTIYRKYYR